MRSSLEYVAWADKKMFNFLNQLPDEVWRAKAREGEWHIAALVFHMVASADWYRYQLGGKLVITEEPESIAEVRALLPTWSEILEFLIVESDKEEELLTYEDEGETRQVLRSGVLTQVFAHSVEHRTQIAWTLKVNSLAEMNLEDYSYWGYRS